MKAELEGWAAGTEQKRAEQVKRIFAGRGMRPQQDLVDGLRPVDIARISRLLASASQQRFEHSGPLRVFMMRRLASPVAEHYYH